MLAVPGSGASPATQEIKMDAESLKNLGWLLLWGGVFRDKFEQAPGRYIGASQQGEHQHAGHRHGYS